MKGLGGSFSFHPNLSRRSLGGTKAREIVPLSSPVNVPVKATPITISRN